MKYVNSFFGREPKKKSNFYHKPLQTSVCERHSRVNNFSDEHSVWRGQEILQWWFCFQGEINNHWMKLDSIFLQLPDNMNNLKIWGVLYMSHVGQKILANFLHIFEQQKQTQILKIPLIESDEEKYSSKSNRMNVALKFLPNENRISIIIFKCFLEVIFKNVSSIYIS